MAVEIRVPALGESVTEATVGQWFKKEGETVNADEPLVELETDKVTVEVPAPSAGTISEITVSQGDTVEIGAVLGAIIEGRGVKLAAVQPMLKKLRQWLRYQACPNCAQKQLYAASTGGGQADGRTRTFCSMA